MSEPADPHTGQDRTPTDGHPPARRTGRPPDNGRASARTPAPETRPNGHRPAPSPGEEADPHCLSPAEADRLLTGAPWRRFAVLGSGIAAAAGDAVSGYQDAGWGHRVAAALARHRPDVKYTNLAEREPLTAEIRASQLEPVLAFRPDLVLVVAGSNDVIRRDFDRGDDVVADYDAMVTALQEAGADVVTATIFDVTRSPRVPGNRKGPLRRRLDHLAGQVRLVARARGTLHLDLAEHPAASAPDLYGADLRFASRRGHAIAAAALVRRLGEQLAGPAT